MPVALVLLAVQSASGATHRPSELATPDATRSTAGFWIGPYHWGDGGAHTPGVHMALLKGDSAYHSKLMWYAYGLDTQVWEWNPTYSEIFNSEVEAEPLPNDPYGVGMDDFCSGLAVFPDGRVMITGGNEVEGIGEKFANIFDPNPIGGASHWSYAPDMSQYRWYPTNTGLADGNIIGFSGQKWKEMLAFGGEEPGRVLSNRLTIYGVRKKPVPITSPSVSGTAPSGREGHTAIFDERNSVLQYTPEPYGPPREWAGRQSFRDNQRVIVFGGETSSGVQNDLYEFKHSLQNEYSWSSISAQGAPPAARTDHTAIARRPNPPSATLSMIVFGGKDASDAPLGDTWALNLAQTTNSGDAWENLTAQISGTAPEARIGHTAVYDPTYDRMIVFGGNDGNDSGTNYYSGVWVLKFGSTMTWTKYTVSGEPSPRAGHIAVLDDVNKRMVVVGGTTNGGSYCASTIYTLSWGAGETSFAWTSVPIESGSVPSARAQMAALIDPLGQGNRLIMMGGETSSGASDEVWALPLPYLIASPPYGNKPVWTLLSSAALPSPSRNLTAVHDPRTINARIAEKYTVSANTWSELSNPNLQKWQRTYPFMFPLPSGHLFEASDYYTEILDLNPAVGWSNTLKQSYFAGASAVMYRPGQILKAGEPCYPSCSNGPYSAWIDLSTSESTSWTKQSSADPSDRWLIQPRTELNLTMLPDGKVLASGGISDRNTDFTGVRTPQIWDPATKQWTSSTNSTTKLADDLAMRDYHSTAVLLPDGRVLTAGGEIAADDGLPAIEALDGSASQNVEYAQNRETACIFYPPYLFTATGALATRPTINKSPTKVNYNTSFKICLTSASAISSVCLIKPGGVTHAFNQDQVYVPLAITESCTAVSGGNIRLTCATPSDANWARPGNYLLFVVNTNGVPSVAKWITLDPTAGASGSGCTCVALASNDRSPTLEVWRNGGWGAARIDDGDLETGLALGSDQAIMIQPERVNGEYRVKLVGPVQGMMSLDAMRFWQLAPSDGEQPVEAAGPRVNLVLAAAEHSRLGSVLPAMEENDGNLVSLRAGEELTLSYRGGTGIDAPAYVLPVAFEQTKESTSPHSVPLLRVRGGEPNPFHETSRLSFQISADSRVRLEIFDIQGRLIRTLADGVYPAGETSVLWDGRDSSDRKVGAGSYMYRVTAGGQQEQRKLTIF